MKIKKELQLKIVLTIAAVAVFLAIIAPMFAPNDPIATNFGEILKPPCDEYPFGTDQVGRCVFSRILYAAKLSLGIPFLLLSLVFVLGLTIGTISGFKGGIVDSIIMRISDTFLSFPSLVFAIAIVGVLGPSALNTILALSFVWWTRYAKLARVLIIEVKGRDFMDAAVMSGASNLKQIFQYIYPNIISVMIVQLAVDVGEMMLAFATLSFLGLGVLPPTPEWGNMLSEGRAYIQTAPWLLYYPGLMIFLAVTIFNVLGDTIRDVLDPKTT